MESNIAAISERIEFSPEEAKEQRAKLLAYNRALILQNEAIAAANFSTRLATPQHRP
jgi:hypothetical protein